MQCKTCIPELYTQTELKQLAELRYCRTCDLFCKKALKLVKNEAI